MSNICFLLWTCGYLHQYAADSMPCLLFTIVSADDGKNIFSHHVWLPREEAMSSLSKYNAVPEDSQSSRKIISILNENACTSSEKRVSGWLLSYQSLFLWCSIIVFLQVSVRLGFPKTLSKTHLTFLSICNLDIHSSQFKAKLTCSRENLRLTGKVADILIIHHPAGNKQPVFDWLVSSLIIPEALLPIRVPSVRRVFGKDLPSCNTRKLITGEQSPGCLYSVNVIRPLFTSLKA